MLTYRPRTLPKIFHICQLFNQRAWGLIIYDEVHLLPAPVFRITAEVQARRRLGLTATLIREDGREGDVFSLIGPKKYDVPWRDLEARGWIAEGHLHRGALSRCRSALRMEYAAARAALRSSGWPRENPGQAGTLTKRMHRPSQGRANALIIGQYLEQLRRRSPAHCAPRSSPGKTPQRERERLYGEFRDWRARAHWSCRKSATSRSTCPTPNVLIQVSGTFGSRQEEAQRLGRVLRPKADGRAGALLHAGDAATPREQDFAHHRQLFLTEQGYSYRILDEEEL